MGSGLPLFPEQASTVAGQVDALFIFLNALTIFFTLLVGITVVTFAVRYRRRSPDEIPQQITGSTVLETSVMVVLLALAMFTFSWAARVYISMSVVPEDALEIYVVGKQWMWKYQHPDGQQEINDLHVPVGRPVRLTMTAQDVIHSFYIPAFRVKQDVLPGRYTTMWFEATKPGTYHMFCTEYCGTNHSRMIGSVIVMDQAQYQTWLSGGPRAEGSPTEMGQQLFQDLGCGSCHRETGGGPGPSLVGVFGQEVQLETGEVVVADESYIQESILRPNEKIVAGFQPLMPTYEGQVNEDDLLFLITYIKSIGAPQPGTSGGAVPGGPVEQAPSEDITPLDDAETGGAQNDPNVGVEGQSPPPGAPTNQEGLEVDPQSPAP